MGVASGGRAAVSLQTTPDEVSLRRREARGRREERGVRTQDGQTDGRGRRTYEDDELGLNMVEVKFGNELERKCEHGQQLRPDTLCTRGQPLENANGRRAESQRKIGGSQMSEGTVPQRPKVSDVKADMEESVQQKSSSTPARCGTLSAQESLTVGGHPDVSAGNSDIEGSCDE